MKKKWDQHTSVEVVPEGEKGAEHSSDEIMAKISKCDGRCKSAKGTTLRYIIIKLFYR